MTCCRRAAATIYIVFFVHLIWWLSASSGGIFCLGREFFVVHGSCAWRSRLGAMSFVHWVSTVVCCTNPDNVHCFGTIFPNLIFVFASICAARPVLIESDQYRSCSTVNKVNKMTTRDRCSRHSSRWRATKNSAVALSSRNNMISIHQRSTRTNEGKTTLV